MRQTAILMTAAVLAATGGGVARAQLGTGGTAGTTGTTTTTTTALAATDFLIRIETHDSGTWAFVQDAQAPRFFNLARCQCEDPVRIRVDLSASGASKVTVNTVGTMKILVGPTTQCVSSAVADRNVANCLLLGTDYPLANFKTNGLEVETTVTQLFQPMNTSPTIGACATAIQENVYLWVDSTMSGAPDAALTDTNAPNLPLTIDGLPPPEPSNVRVQSGGGALAVSWDQLTGVADFAGGGFVVYCTRGGQYQVFNPSSYGGDYSSASLLCPDGPGTLATSDTGSTTGALTVTDAGPMSTGASAGPMSTDASVGEVEPDVITAGANGTAVAAPSFFATPDPHYQCSPLLTSQTSYRIEGLQNGVPYVVGVGAVDHVGNLSPITSAVLQYPVATTDFYQGYRAAGGQATGGFCAVGPGRGGSRALGALAGIAFVALAGRGWRRRSARKSRP